MTVEEAVKALDALTAADRERAHGEADDIVSEVMRANGLAAVADAYDRASERVGFWYA